jgi:hypothetical protein
MPGLVLFVLVLVAMGLLAVPGAWIFLFALSCGFLFADY